MVVVVVVVVVVVRGCSVIDYRSIDLFYEVLLNRVWLTKQKRAN